MGRVLLVATIACCLYTAAGAQLIPYQLDEYSFILPGRQFDDDAYGFTRDFLIGNDVNNPDAYNGAVTVTVDVGTDDQRTEQYVAEAIDYNYIVALKNYIVPTGTETNYNFFPAVRVYYGLDVATNHIVLIFFPMNAVRPDAETLEFAFDYGDLIDGANKPYGKTMYVWSAGAWQPMTYTAGGTLEKWVTDYRKNIWFRKLGGKGGFIKNPNAFEGIKSIAFSFQEVDFLKDSYASVSHNNNPIIYITSLSSAYRVGRDYRLKHKLAFSVYPPGTLVRSIPFVADLGSLCPVNCTTLTVANGVLRFLER